MYNLFGALGPRIGSLGFLFFIDLPFPWKGQLVDKALEVTSLNQFLYIILKVNAFFSIMIMVTMVSTVCVSVPFLGATLIRGVWSRYPSFFAYVNTSDLGSLTGVNHSCSLGGVLTDRLNLESPSSLVDLIVMF